MNCGAVVRRLSAYREADLGAAESRAVAHHLRSCAECEAEWSELCLVLEDLADLPRMEPREPIAGRVFDRLDMEARRPSLATLFRPFGSERPLILPSLASAVAVLATIVSAAVRLDRAPEPLPPVAAAARPAQWRTEPPAWGSERLPLLPSAEVSTPRARGVGFTADVPEHSGEGSLFLETIVARDGTVSAVNLLDGDTACAQYVMAALRQQRFEPGRFRGRPVAVSVYMLISHTEVRAPIT
ncbi:MAG TPA: zf-HC2 domain-containing protein [Vicinamibacteria bacterium]|nr:zf-HC2 domain-containing protein [Vicinamibacteria bacterium]